jgi:hypothetical protein
MLPGAALIGSWFYLVLLSGSGITTFPGCSPFKVPGKLFRVFKVFSIRSALIQSPEQFEKTVRVETCTTEFTDNRVPFGLQFLPERRMIFFQIILC